MTKIGFAICISMVVGLSACSEQATVANNKATTSSSSTSLKPQSQLAFEVELKNLQERVRSSGQPGTRAFEEAQDALDNFWKNKKSSLTRVDEWVCMYTNSYKWVPADNINNPMKTSSRGPVEYDQYEILSAFCTDADKPYKALDVMRGGEIGVRILVSKAKDIQPLYAGDVIAVSGPVREGFSIQPNVNSYRIDINADSIKIVKKGS